MALEPITRQEQIIAGKDLEPITRMEKFLKEYGGGGGASSWNELTDRPFGEVTTYGDTLTWDGNTDGRTLLNDTDGNLVACHVSNAVPTLTEIENNCSLTTENGSVLTPMTMDTGNALMVMSYPYVVYIAPNDNTDMDGMIAPKKGVYFSIMEGNYITSLTINGYNGFETTAVKPIDTKYLEPFETVGGDTLTWDGNTEGLTSFMGQGYKVTEVCPTLAEAQNGGGAKVYNGTEFVNETITSDAVMSLADMFGVAGFMIQGSTGMIAVGVADNCEVDGEAIEKGLYFINVDGVWTASLTINGYTGFTTTKLKEEYLPYTDAESEVF